jgi:hypothetical protein
MSSELLRRYDALNADLSGTLATIRKCRDEIHCLLTMSDVNAHLDELERLSRSVVFIELQRDAIRTKIANHLDSAIFLTDDCVSIEAGEL